MYYFRSHDALKFHAKQLLIRSNTYDIRYSLYDNKKINLPKSCFRVHCPLPAERLPLSGAHFPLRANPLTIN